MHECESVGVMPDAWQMAALQPYLYKGGIVDKQGEKDVSDVAALWQLKMRRAAYCKLCQKHVPTKTENRNPVGYRMHMGTVIKVCSPLNLW